MKIQRDQIVEAALDLLGEVGLDKLSTRLVAHRLGVQQPALYWHFKNKQQLLAAMNAEVLRREHTRREPQPGERWQDFVLANALSFRRCLLSYRDGARMHAGSEPDAQDLAPIEAQIAFLVQAGFTPSAGMELMIAVGRYVVGCVLEEQAAPDATTPDQAAALDAATQPYPNLAAAVAHYRAAGPEQMFTAGLAMLIDGAAARLVNRARTTGPSPA